MEIREGFSIATPPLRSHRSDPQTSLDAATANRTASSHATSVLLALRLYGAQTAAELATHLEFDRIEVQRRCSDLLKLGKIARRNVGTFDGKPIWHTRKGPTGALMCVYYLA